MILPIYALSALLAMAEAWRDFMIITSGTPISLDDHEQRWIDRALIIVFASGIGLAATLNVIGAIASAIGAAFLFSALFRYRQNYLRRLSPFYMGFSNRYDMFFLSLANIRNKGDESTWNINRAGLIAYITETAIAVAALVVYY